MSKITTDEKTTISRIVATCALNSDDALSISRFDNLIYFNVRQNISTGTATGTTTVDVRDIRKLCDKLMLLAESGEDS